MTSDHLAELSPDRLELWRLILPERRASCDFPLLGRSDLFYEDPPTGSQAQQARYVPGAEDAVLVQVRRPDRAGKPGALFFLNTAGHMVQRTYLLADLGITDPVYLCDWGNRSLSEEPTGKIALTLAGHHSALYFFSEDPISEIPANLPS